MNFPTIGHSCFTSTLTSRAGFDRYIFHCLVVYFDDTSGVLSRARSLLLYFSWRFVQLVELGRCLSSKTREEFAMFYVTFLLYRGLNQMIWFALFLLCAFCCCFLYFKLVLNPFSFKAFSCSGLFELNIVSYDKFSKCCHNKKISSVYLHRLVV